MYVKILIKTLIIIFSLYYTKNMIKPHYIYDPFFLIYKGIIALTHTRYYLFATIMILIMLPLLGTAISSSTIILPKKESNNRVPIYVIGETPKKLEELLLSGMIKGEVIQYNLLEKIPPRKGIVFITRKLIPVEENIVSSLLKEGYVIISLNDQVKQQIDQILSKIAMFTVTFNGTHTYLYKIISSTPIKGNRLPLVIKGYAGRGLSKEVLVDAIDILDYESSDWQTIGWVNWSSRDYWKPYGKLNVDHEILYYKDDPWNNMDLYAVRCTTQIISGAKLGWTDEDAWWNDYIESHYYLNYYTNIYDLRDYDPTSIYNIPMQVSVSLGWPPSVGLTWNYPGDYIIYISDDSDLGDNYAGWKHQLGTPGLYDYATRETVKIRPGFEFTVSPEITGKQRWEITGGWVVPARYYPYKPFKGTIVIELTIYYG